MYGIHNEDPADDPQPPTSSVLTSTAPYDHRILRQNYLKLTLSTLNQPDNVIYC